MKKLQDETEVVESPAPLGGTTFADEIAAETIEANKATLRNIGLMIFVAATVYFGILNFGLYARGFVAPGTATITHGGPFTLAQLFALIPAVAISGSVLALTLSGIGWFSVGTQAQVGKIAGYGLFAVEAANGVAEWLLSTGKLTATDEFISAYAAYGVPAMVVLVALVWKIVIDHDEKAEIVREHNLTMALMRKRKRAAQMKFLDDPLNIARIARAGQVAARRLTEAHTQAADDLTVVMPKEVDAASAPDGQAGEPRPLES
jgi:hypothetical protein